MMKKLFLTLTVMLALSAMAKNEPFLTKVYDFMPAPGQFVNTMPDAEAGDTKESILKRVEDAICGRYEENDWGQMEMIYKPGMISLGSYGGYVVVGFDHPVVNVKGDYDFQIFGNGMYTTNPNAGGSSEPGIVLVSYDANGNGLPDDPWYELAGSEYSSPKTQHNYTITYYKPDENKVKTPDPVDKTVFDNTYIRWTSNDVNPDSISGYVYKNVFHGQSYWPQWVEDETLTFSGTKLCNNAVLVGGQDGLWVQLCKEWGYVDNRMDNDPLAPREGFDTAFLNNGFKIDWAVDADGVPVYLPMVHFIKVHNAVIQNCGRFGETSTEVGGGLDYHPQTEAPKILKGDVNADGEVNVSDVTTLTAYIQGTKHPGYNPVTLDVNGDGNVDAGDVTALISITM